MPKLIGALLGVTLAIAGCAPRVAGPGVDDDVIAVNGVGKVNAVPDAALLTLGVDANAASLGDATSDAARRMSAVVARIKSFGVSDDDIQTVTYSVDPRMATADPLNRDAPPRIVGYHVANVVQVTVRKVPDAGPVLDAAVAAGANAVRGVRFTLADPAAAQSQARAAAVNDAQTKARQLAAAAGIKLGPVLSLRETSVSQPIPMRAVSMAMRAEAVTPIEAGQLEISVAVELRQAIAR
jgi:uncharacterized protein YggE